VAGDVDWTVEGTHPLAGRYRNKGEFIDSTFTRIAGVLPGGVKLDIKHLDVDGETTIAELHSTSTTNEGADFFNDYGWVCRFQDDIMVEVRAYLDSMMVAQFFATRRRKTGNAPLDDGYARHGASHHLSRRRRPDVANRRGTPLSHTFIRHDDHMGSANDKPRKRRHPLPKVPKYEEPNTLPLPGLTGNGGSGDASGRFGHGSDGKEHHPPRSAGRAFLRMLGMRRKDPEKD
jgi:hypothetical protein